MQSHQFHILGGMLHRAGWEHGSIDPSCDLTFFGNHREECYNNFGGNIILQKLKSSIYFRFLFEA